MHKYLPLAVYAVHKYLPLPLNTCHFLLCMNMYYIGGIVRVCGLAMTPRIILMTDGEPSDEAGSLEVLPRILLFYVSPIHVYMAPL